MLPEEGDDGEVHSTDNEALSIVSYRIEWNMRHALKPTYETLFEMLKYSSWRVAFFVHPMCGDNNLGDDTPGASCVSCICSKNHKLSATDQATCSGGFHLLKQQELRKTQSGAQQRSHMFQQQRGSLRRNPKHKC
ncbi:unnamed protein product [Brassica rapa]|nr:unnamed protein product [Brassica rapa]